MERDGMARFRIRHRSLCHLRDVGEILLRPALTSTELPQQPAVDDHPPPLPSDCHVRDLPFRGSEHSGTWPSDGAHKVLGFSSALIGSRAGYVDDGPRPPSLITSAVTRDARSRIHSWPGSRV